MSVVAINEKSNLNYLKILNCKIIIKRKNHTTTATRKGYDNKSLTQQWIQRWRHQIYSVDFVTFCVCVCMPVTTVTVYMYLNLKCIDFVVVHDLLCYTVRNFVDIYD